MFFRNHKLKSLEIFQKSRKVPPPPLTHTHAPQLRVEETAAQTFIHQILAHYPQYSQTLVYPMQ